MRVLIADNDKAFLEILLPYFWRQGHETEIAANGLDCIAIMRDFQPNAVIIDAGLLWGGGSGVIAMMNEDPQLFDIPVILVADSQEEVEAIPYSGPVHWIQKPFGLNDLLAQLQTAILRVRPRTQCVG